MKTHKSRTWMEKSSRPTPRPACAPRQRPPEYSPARRGRVPARGLSGEVRLPWLENQIAEIRDSRIFLLAPYTLYGRSLDCQQCYSPYRPAPQHPPSSQRTTKRRQQ